MNITVFQERCQESFYGIPYLLHVLDGQFRYDARKQPMLFNIQNALIGNDPNIEIIVHPIVVNKEPGEEIEDTAKHDGNHCYPGIIRKSKIKHLHRQEIRHQWNSQHENEKNKFWQENNPVAADNHFCFFIGSRSEEHTSE